MRTYFVSGFAALLLLSACAAKTPTPAAPTAASAAALEGAVWTLRDSAGQPASAQPVTLRFESGTVSGRAPCNSVSASYTLDGDGLRFGPIARSKMYCADTSALEDAYLAALRQIDRATIEGGTLTLSGAGARLDFVGAPDK